MPELVQETSLSDSVNAAFEKWIKALGLAWWDIDVHAYDDPAEVVRLFANGDNSATIAAIATANWMYGSGKVEVNLLALAGIPQDQLDRIVVHELMHFLVNEMRENELKHEERVVTNLTKAFFWALDALARGFEEEKEVVSAPDSNTK